MKYSSYRRVLAFLLLAFVSTIGIAQNTDHTKAITALKNMAGTWNVEVEARLAQQGPWEKSTATSVIRESLKGTIFEEDFTGTRQGKVFLIKTLFAVNNLNGKFQRIFADSEHGVLVDFEGEKKNDSLFLDKNISFPNGNKVTLRVVYYFKSADEFIVESLRMPMGTNTWDLTGRMRYIRSGKSVGEP